MPYCEKYGKNFSGFAIQFSIVTVDPVKTSIQFNAHQEYFR